MACGASQAAAGMLGAQTEMHDTGPLFELGRRSRAMFPALAEELEELTGTRIGLVREGLLNVAFTDEESNELCLRGAQQRKAGEPAQWLSAGEVLEMEPALQPTLKGALYLQEDGQVDAPLLALAWIQAAARLGVKMYEDFGDIQLIVRQGKAVGVRTAKGPMYAECVIVAAGVGTGAIFRHIGIELPVYPVKGECFSVLTPQPILQKSVFTSGCYLVPKAGGRLVIGATVKAFDHDRKVTLEGIAQLMERAQRIAPVIAGAEWEKAWSGLRPQTPDGLPYLGLVPGYNNLFVAAGHYRNGILLSPITGRIIAEMVHGKGADSNEEIGNWLKACDPARAAVEGKELSPL
jgi:glycine oxidase